MMPKIWKGGDVWVIGGGPSMPKQFNIPEEVVRSVVEGTESPSAYSPYMSILHDKHVIAVNAAFMIGDWIDIIFFGDSGFLRKYERELAAHPALKVACHPEVQDYNWIKFLSRDRHPFGISRTAGTVSWNGNSGAAAISMAVHSGAKRVLLLGFDMCLVDNRQHWHGLYRMNGSPPKIRKKNGHIVGGVPFDRHLHGFPIIARDAKQFGVQILNVSAESRIKDFHKTTINEVLNGNN